LSQVAIAAGATMVARWTTFQARQLRKQLLRQFFTPDFLLYEVISQCPVQYGKVIKKETMLLIC
jgi:2-oxoglutarate ferredoxin oxidoreductase subunit beta